MTLTLAQTAYSSYQSPYSDAVTGFALIPGSRRVWWREGRKVVECNVSFCRHAKLYPDGTVVNHVPYSFSLMGGAINGHVDEEVQLAAFTFLSWLMNDANQIEAVINPLNSVGLSIVRPSLLVPSLWKEHGWQDPAVSLFSAISTANAEHPNVALDLRLPNAIAYRSVIADTVTSYWLGTGDYHDLTVEEGALRAAAEIQLRMQAITDLGDLDVAIENYHKMLGIYMEPTDEARVRSFSEIPNWAMWTSGILVGILCVIFASLGLGWLTMTHLHRRRLRAKDEEKMMCIIDEAKAAVTYLHFPMAVVGASDFLELDHLVNYESLREEGKLVFLTSLSKIEEFKEERCIVVFSHQWLGWSSSDPLGTHFRTMCSAVRVLAQMMTDRGDAKVQSINDVYIWVDVCSTTQAHRATRELAVTSLPLFITACDMFVVIAPPAVHSDLNVLCNLETFLARGWCRAEILTKVTSTGFENLFVCESTTGQLQPMSEETLEGIDLRVFDGTSLAVWRSTST